MKQLTSFVLILTAKIVPPNFPTEQNTNILASYLEIIKWRDNENTIPYPDKITKSPKEGLTSKLKMKFHLKQKWLKGKPRLPEKFPVVFQMLSTTCQKLII